MADGITTTFTDNVEVTAEDLNNIAIDLGYTDFKEFSADEKFGNDALNRITADLVSSGILNLENRCKCSLVTDDNGVTKINVATGVAVFADGSKIRITKPQTLDIIDGGTNYVYFKNDTNTGKATLENSLTEPVGDFVKLCKVTNDTLMDERMYAKANGDLSAESNSYCVSFTDIVVDNENPWTISVNVTGISDVFILIPGNALYKFNVNSQTFTGAAQLFNTSDVAPIDSTSVTVDYNATWYSSTILSCDSLINNIAIFKLSTGRYFSAEKLQIYAYGGI